MAVKLYSKTVNAKKKQARLRRAKRSRMHIRNLQTQNPELVRLVITRSSAHITAQLVKHSSLEGKSVVIATATTKEPALREQCKSTGNIDAAKVVGKAIAERAKALNVADIAFDRSGYLYHGRVKALADAARENGLEF